MVGSTELGERFDPEVMRGVMARFYAAVREPIERHGGTVEKVIGDALVAVFGIPVVREDDALRAVRAALEMRDAVRAMGDIQARIGVNTGDVLARDATPGESLVVGDAVNVAARLEQAAEPGEVLVGEATWALVGHAARGERVAPVAAKGKRDPLVGVAARGRGSLGARPAPPARPADDRPRGRARSAALGARPHRPDRQAAPGDGASASPGSASRGSCWRCRAWRADLAVLDRPVPRHPGRVVARAAARGRPRRPPGGSRCRRPRSPRSCPAIPMRGAVAACLTAERTAAAPDVGWAVSRLIGSMATSRTVVIVLEDVHLGRRPAA